MNDNQSARYFRVEDQLRYHWGADEELMSIIITRDKSPELSELVTRRIKSASPGAIRPLWNKYWKQKPPPTTPKKQWQRMNLEPTPQRPSKNT